MVVFYPNNIDPALEEGDYNFVASKTALVIMTALPEPWSHKHWNK